MTVTRPRCSSSTAAGKPCRNFAVAGSDRCSSHLGRTGTKTLLTPELTDQIAKTLSAGTYLSVAARAAGISPDTLDDWLHKGREGDKRYVDLLVRVERARAEGEARNVTHIARAAATSWQAAAWLLERMYPERWGRVSVRLRDEEPPAPAELETDLDFDDPFREVDELAEKRRSRAG